MSIDENYSNSFRNGSVLLIILGLFISMDHPILGPIFIPFVIFLIVMFYRFKNKNEGNEDFYRIIMMLSIILMFTLELFLVPIQNLSFYTCLILFSVGFFIDFHLSFISIPNRKEKILTCIGLILFSMVFPILIGYIG